MNIDVKRGQVHESLGGTRDEGLGWVFKAAAAVPGAETAQRQHTEDYKETEREGERPH